LFDIFDSIIADENENLRLASASILYHSLVNDSASARKYCLNQYVQGSDRPLIRSVIDTFLVERDPGLTSQFSEIIRIFLDTSGLNTEGVLVQASLVESDVDKFLEFFYEKEYSHLLRPIGAMESDTDRCMHLAEYLCDFIMFSINQHAMFSKNFLMTTNTLTTVANLLKLKATNVILSENRLDYRRLEFLEFAWARMTSFTESY
jgi:hypothetical protein